MASTGLIICLTLRISEYFTSYTILKYLFVNNRYNQISSAFASRFMIDAEDENQNLLRMISGVRNTNKASPYSTLITLNNKPLCCLNDTRNCRLTADVRSLAVSLYVCSCLGRPSVYKYNRFDQLSYETNFELDFCFNRSTCS